MRASHDDVRRRCPSISKLEVAEHLPLGNDDAIAAQPAELGRDRVIGLPVGAAEVARVVTEGERRRSVRRVDVLDAHVGSPPLVGASPAEADVRERADRVEGRGCPRCRTYAEDDRAVRLAAGREARRARGAPCRRCPPPRGDAPLVRFDDHVGQQPDPAVAASGRPARAQRGRLRRQFHRLGFAHHRPAQGPTACRSDPARRSSRIRRAPARDAELAVDGDRLRSSAVLRETKRRRSPISRNERCVARSGSDRRLLAGTGLEAQRPRLGERKVCRSSLRRAPHDHAQARSDAQDVGDPLQMGTSSASARARRTCTSSRRASVPSQGTAGVASSSSSSARSSSTAAAARSSPWCCASTAASNRAAAIWPLPRPRRSRPPRPRKGPGVGALTGARPAAAAGGEAHGRERPSCSGCGGELDRPTSQVSARPVSSARRAVVPWVSMAAAARAQLPAGSFRHAAFASSSIWSAPSSAAERLQTGSADLHLRPRVAASAQCWASAVRPRRAYSHDAVGRSVRMGLDNRVVRSRSSHARASSLPRPNADTASCSVNAATARLSPAAAACSTAPRSRCARRPARPRHDGSARLLSAGDRASSAHR